MALAVRRYDRTPEGRVHQEDCAQVLGRPIGEQGKYEGNYETLGTLVLARAGREDFRALVRRLVFVVLSDNADAHLKNWSLVYPDRVHPRLAPAYDLVFVGAYEGYGRRLALKLGRTRRFEEIRTSTFRAFGERVSSRVSSVMSTASPLDPAEVETWASEDAAHILDAWKKLRESLPLSTRTRERLEAHFARVPLARRE
jgi:serine/threonine-protein kinase HipA